MSDRIEALGAVLKTALGDRATVQAARILADLMVAGYVVVDIHTELAAAVRQDGFLLRVATEIERDYSAIATGVAMDHAEEIDFLGRDDARNPSHPRED